VTPSRRASLPILIALAGSALLVYWTSTSRPLWVDEEMLLLNVRDRGLTRLAGPLWLDQSAPLGWLVLQRLMLRALGSSEPAVRALTTAFGVAALMTAAWIGRRWMSAGAAALFVALCALGEWPVFFTLELKHYSADVTGALLVPAAAARALEAPRQADLGSRVLAWWIVAAASQWFSNGALFVTPLCAAVVLVFVARTRDRRALALATAGVAIWFCSFALNYALVLRHAAANAYLKSYWAFAFPPVANGLRASLDWIAAQISSFAVKPASTGLPLLFWLTWLVGVAYAIANPRTRAHGLMIATVPLAALALAFLHVVPPFERLAIWVVGSTYAAIAYALDGAAALAAARGRYRPAVAAAGVAVLALALAVPIDVLRRGVHALASRPHSNYGLDDRRSIGTLLATHRPGDVVLTTHYGLAALWWYGRIPVSDARASGRLADGSPIYEIGYAEPGDCARARGRLDAALAGRRRAAVYLGFRMNVEPVGFDELVMADMGRRGALESYKEYAEESRVAVFDLDSPRAEPDAVPGRSRIARLPGCVGVKPAARW
jgi:hypothetical protein